MATFATLEDLKEQCNVQHNEDDKRLREMLDAAESWLEKTVQQPLTDIAAKHRIPARVEAEPPRDLVARIATIIPINVIERHICVVMKLELNFAALRWR